MCGCTRRCMDTRAMQGVTLHTDCIACKHFSCQNTFRHDRDKMSFSALGLSLHGAMPLLTRMQEGAALPRQASPAAVCLALILSSTSCALLSAWKLSTILILLLRGWHWKVPCCLRDFRLIACSASHSEHNTGGHHNILAHQQHHYCTTECDAYQSHSVGRLEPPGSWFRIL